MASVVASFNVLEPLLTSITSAPSSFMRRTFIDWRCMSSVPMYTVHSRPKRAHTVAVATPCWPAPVSAMIRRLPMRRDWSRRSEEHTSELQSHSDLVCRLLLEKKNDITKGKVAIEGVDLATR